MKYITILLLLILCSCKTKSSNPDTAHKTDSAKIVATNDTEIACKLSSTQLEHREETVLANLKKQVIEKKELPNGYAFKFKGSDKMIDELINFIKTERECCDFFNFKLAITGDTNAVWLELTGPKNAKEFIASGFDVK